MTYSQWTREELDFLWQKELEALKRRNGKTHSPKLPEGTQQEELKKYFEFNENFWQDPECMIRSKPLERGDVQIDGRTFSFYDDRIYNAKATYQLVYCPWNREYRNKAMIVAPVWNADPERLRKGIKWISGGLAQCDVFVYMPEQEISNGKIIPDYSIVSPDLEETLESNWKNIRSHRRMAKFLKEVLGYEKVGALGYSIGAHNLFIATAFTENPFDCGIYQYLADSWAESVINGHLSQEVAKKISDNGISEDELKTVWSSLDPGAYLDFLDQSFPRRIVHGAVDCAFGTENSGLFMEKVREQRPEIETEIGYFGHVYWDAKYSLGPTIRHGEFMRKHLGVPGHFIRKPFLENLIKIIGN